ncbi:hypothetical protein SASPL_143481 [Salvia splendens]|uniref:HAT C-terminal dimerisation domain-containing protein n=1 Tax=Salvia splendens TaxID=180675 RepID=A0A8X8WM51_SALSN|nr:hypothetical protein SASPL_143481 [Salvia splendens]
MEVWNIAQLLEMNSRSHDEVVRSMSLLMKSKFEKYWEDYSDILSMGAVFDPRMKLKLVEYCYSTLDPLSSQDKVNRLKMKLYTLYDEYQKKSVDASSIKIPQSNGSSNSEGYKSYKGLTSDTKSALDVYLKDLPMDEDAEIDLLKYRKEKSSRFGVLARMVCDMLSIPITTVASESSFNIEAHVLNKYRNRLLPKKVQALICTRNWLHGYSNDGDSEDDEEEANAQAEVSKLIDLEECHSNI